MIPPGREQCPACDGNGGRWAIADGVDVARTQWVRCLKCDGLGHAWQAGGPMFGCQMTLGDREAGEIVELGSGERARIAWHQPRKAPRQRPSTTFVVLEDVFGDFEPNPVGCASELGVRSVSVKIEAAELRDNEKDADALDPFARRQRERRGSLL